MYSTLSALAQERRAGPIVAKLRTSAAPYSITSSTVTRSAFAFIEAKRIDIASYGLGVMRVARLTLLILTVLSA
jgi:hypothetical protein